VAAFLNHPFAATTWQRLRTPHLQNLNHPSTRATWLSFCMTVMQNLNHPLHEATWLRFCSLLTASAATKRVQRGSALSALRLQRGFAFIAHKAHSEPAPAPY
jgi:hypothetical protein